MFYTDSAALIGYARNPRELRRRMHHAIPPGKWRRPIAAGHSHAFVAFRFHVAKLWRLTLRKRGQKDQTTWDWIAKIVDDGPFVV